MPTKKDVKRLLKKGLTGKEAAQLVIQDSWEIDNHRKPLLSMTELKTVISSLSPQEGAEYNKWIEMYKIISFTLKESHIQALTIMRALDHIVAVTKSIVEANSFRASQPAIVTQKQYDELLAKWQVGEHEETVDLWDAAAQRAYELATEEQRERNYHDFNTLAASEEELLRAALEQFLDLEERGQLELKGSDSPRETVKALLSADWSGWDEEEEDRAFKPLGLIQVQAGQLYEAGLPEWKEWIDTLKPGLDNDLEGNGIAIIQKPESYQVDERGYYRSSFFENSSSFIGYWLRDRMRKRGDSLEESLDEAIKKQKANIRSLLAYQEVVTAVSELIGVDMGEGIREWLSDIDRLTQSYRIFNKPNGHLTPLTGMQLPPIELSKLKPIPASVQYLRERVAMALGENWYLKGDKDKDIARHIGEALEAAKFPGDSDNWEPESEREASSDD